MKKKILFSAFAIACVCMVSLQIKKSSINISNTDISLSNLDAMASSEGGDSGCWWSTSRQECTKSSYAYMCSSFACN